MSQESRQDVTGQVRDRIVRVIKASRAARRVRACLLSTRDRDHAIALLKEAVTVVGETALHHFTVSARRRFQPQDLRWETVGQGPNDTFSLLDEAQRLRGGSVVVLEDCTPFLRDEGGDQRVRMLLAQMLSAETQSDGLVLVFVEPPEAGDRLPAILRDQFVRLDIPYPRTPELRAIATQEIALLAHRTGNTLAPEQTRDQAGRLANELVGLTRSAARDALWDALAADPDDSEGAYRRLSVRKAEQLSRDLAMNILETAGAEEPVGLDNLVDYLKVAQDRMRVSGPQRARGVLLIGPPGTGKTMLARAIGRLVSLPVVEFRLSALMNSLLGETERRFAQAFQTLEAMGPNVVFIDEIEKAFGDSSERDGGTMMRCTGALLSWLSDNPYPNYIVATSNSLRRMGEIGLTMTRSERFDAAFFVDVPGHAARQKMLEKWLREHVGNSAAVADEIAGLTEKFSGADLRSVFKQALHRAAHENQPLTRERLGNEVERKRARAVALYDEFRELRHWGQQHCDPASTTND
ncbi:MAG: ATP-binding protein [Gammaproteobacteria bacterium]|nr:ATP-binding protein [Gammaproteobacteria bacterium]